METFDNIYVKAYCNGAWVDLSADVLAPIRISGIGIMNYAPNDRVGNSARLSFSLDNSELNSVLTRGYYTPQTASTLNGWDTGVIIMVYFVYDGIYSYKFYGKIDPDGIDVTAGVKGKRTVKVTASSWMKQADSHTLNLLQFATNKTGNEAIELLLDNVTNQPLTTQLQTGTRIFPTMFDISNKNTKISSEFRKIAMSELGYIYERGSVSSTEGTGGSTLVFDNRTYRYSQRNTASTIPLHSTEAPGFLLLETGDYVLLETGDEILLESSQDAIFDETDIVDLKPEYGKNIYNVAKITSRPRRVDASPVVLWQLESPIQLEPNQIVNNMRGAFRDPDSNGVQVSGIDMITPVSGTDYACFANEDASGTNLTAYLSITAEYGTSEVQYTLQNTGTESMWITTLQARGYGVYVYDSVYVQHESPSSIANYGVSEIDIDMPYVSNATELFTTSNSVDLMLLETGDQILLEDETYMRGDSEAGIFDVLLSDVPRMYAGKASFIANRDKFNMLAFMSLDAGSFIKLSETMTGIDNEISHCITGYDVEVKSGKIVEWHPVLVPADTYIRI